MRLHQQPLQANKTTTNETKPKSAAPSSVSAYILQMQKTFGNRAVMQMMKLAVDGAMDESSDEEVMEVQNSQDEMEEEIEASSQEDLGVQDELMEEQAEEIEADEENIAATRYTNSVGLRDTSGKAVAVTADKVRVGSILFPQKLRPPTQFPGKQNAHTISWTLLKKSYEAVGSLDVKTFLKSHLQQDWVDLAKQKDLPDPDKRPDEQELNQELVNYLGEYNDTFFNNLDTAELTPLQWAQQIQTIVTDLFAAIQLAPLTTHAGFTQKMGKGGSEKGIQDTQPYSHAEGDANTYFAGAEQKMAKRHSTLKNKKTQPDEKVELLEAIKKDAVTVMEYAKSYWDIGKGYVGGINGEKRLQYLHDEYLKIFGRAYPNITRYYLPALSHLLKENKAEGFDLSKIELPAENPMVVDKEAEGELAPGKVLVPTGAPKRQEKFQVRMELANKKSTSLFTANDLQFDHLKMSDDRVYTKYFITGQKSHTVSWSLVRESLIASAKGKSVAEFLHKMLRKWEFLKDQDWTSLTEGSFLKRADYSEKKRKSLKDKTIEEHNQANRARNKGIVESIQSNLLQSKAALLGLGMTDLAWAAFLQAMISDYVVAYNSSPLASYKDGKPDGHGESDATKYMNTLEEMLAKGSVDKEMVTEKFLKEFQKGKLKFNDKETEKRIKKLIEDLKENKELSADEEKEINIAVLKKLALKHLDIKWSAFTNGFTEDERRTNMAMILYEWESAIKEKYPVIWERYGTELETYANKFRRDQKKTDSETLNDQMSTVRTKYRPVKPEEFAGLPMNNPYKQSMLNVRNEAAYRDAVENVKILNKTRAKSTVEKLAVSDFNRGLHDGNNKVPSAEPHCYGYMKGYEAGIKKMKDRMGLMRMHSSLEQDSSNPTTPDERKLKRIKLTNVNT